MGSRHVVVAEPAGLRPTPVTLRRLVSSAKNSSLLMVVVLPQKDCKADEGRSEAVLGWEVGMWVEVGWRNGL